MNTDAKRRGLLTIGFALALMIATGNRASAQYRPMPPDPYDPATNFSATTQSALAPNVAAIGAQSAAVAAAPAWQAPQNYAQNGYPAAEVQAVPVAKARATLARAQMEQARRNLGEIIDNLKEDFEYSASFLAAMADVKTAQDAYDKVRNRVLVDLYSDAKYKALVDLRNRMNEQLEELKSSHASRSEILATAAVKLDYATQLSDREANALAADQSVQDARRRLTDAGARVSEMRTRFNRGVKRQDVVVAARRDFNSARIGHLEADALLVSAIDAREIALDYAYFTHRYDLYRYLHVDDYNNFYPYGFAYGGVNSGLIYRPFSTVMFPR